MGKIKLVAFDLDGALLRGDTVCLSIAKELGHYDRMLEMEEASESGLIDSHRKEMASWYLESGRERVDSGLKNVTLAPGAEEGCRLLAHHGVTIAIVSVTWQFAVETFAKRLGATHHIATALDWTTGEIDNFYGEDKGPWLEQFMSEQDLSKDQVASVGDTMSDNSLLLAAGTGFCVGGRCMSIEGVRQRPDANIFDLAEEILNL